MDVEDTVVDSPKKSKKEKKEKKEKSSPKKEKKDKKKKKKKDDSTEEEASDAEKKNKKRSHADSMDVDDESESASVAADDASGAESKKRAKTADHSDAESDAVDPKLLLSNFRLSDGVLASLEKRGIRALFPIQAATFDSIFDGKDVLGRARTGTGKTLAFSLPMAERLIADAANGDGKLGTGRGRAPKIIVMAPTRELARQVSAEFESIAGNIQVLTVYGGVAYDQQNFGLRQGVDVVIGTPGRIMDHLERGTLRLDNIRFICLDEADQMLDIGFADAMEKVLQAVQEQKAAHPGSSPYQTLLFSATLPEWVHKVVKKYLREDYVTVDLVGQQKLKTNENITHYGIPSHWEVRRDIMGDVVAVYGGTKTRTIIFVNTKAEANELAMNEKLKQEAQVLHGDIPQNQRERTLQGFRDGRFRCIICTDVAARGLDIPDVDLVINSQPPQGIETYIHRSGRTGRAGRKGVCVTFYKPAESNWIRQLERRIGTQVNVVGAPQPVEIIRATASDAAETVAAVSTNVVPHFEATAASLIERMGAERALAAALACLSGYAAGLPSRSLLNGKEGAVTLHCKLNREIRGVGYVRTALERGYGITFDDMILMRMCADSCGVVFDIKQEKVSVASDGTVSLNGQEFVSTDEMTLEAPTTLPALQEREGQGAGGGRGGYGGRGGFGGRGGYGGRGGRGGRGGYGGGRGGRGGYGRR
ncbi:P-loop containing nucleoside triphosphate hydrolase protein [Thamnocephalis sphaerospora]|uniref:RNA helicase n=1 Tax=Thamnocephalis sphaerospora TaxID=78915 RepID=A0A4P9XI65_9FUNG|nr:P-loop containing nucleoside triphosphate hydrolase protein [Thamnocephalis sphaerospora]|eukprot:RKP05367.1 P-loop containing nucleoside triphosphate hydrolase protein [Thamnocephalis sphaerospora]